MAGPDASGSRRAVIPAARPMTGQSREPLLQEGMY
jgi:hypothetical protein